MFILLNYNWAIEYIIRQWSGRPGFNPKSSHNKDLKNAALRNTQH